jgi:hypothetical protein
VLAGAAPLPQRAVPLGEPLIAVVNAPFWLDFRRNPIHDVELAGLAVPWARVPDGRYVIWEHAGPATPQLRHYAAQKAGEGLQRGVTMTAGLQLTLALIELARSARILHDDGQMMVLQLGAGELRTRYRSSAGSARAILATGSLEVLRQRP